jgi:RNA polymerase sigma-70 factor, ECF subfamily
MAVDVQELYTKYGPMVLRRCRAILGDEEAALDAMQDTFVQVLKKQETLTGEAPSSMLYTFATNICLNSMRAQKRTPVPTASEQIEQYPGTDDPEGRTLSRHFTERLLASEKQSTRDITRYHYLEERTLHETAGLVGMSVSGVRKRLRSLRGRSLALREV